MAVFSIVLIRKEIFARLVHLRVGHLGSPSWFSVFFTTGSQINSCNYVKIKSFSPVNKQNFSNPFW